MKYKTKLLLIGLAGGLLSGLFFCLGLYGQDPVVSLIRPESGAGDQETSLLVELQGKKYPLNIQLHEIPYEEDEAGKQLREAAGRLEELFLNGNRNPGHIVSKVSMPSVFPDSPIEIQWYLDSWKYVEPDGTVKNESLKEETPVRVQAVLSLGGQSMTWERELAVCPPENPDAGQKIKMLQYQLQEAQETPAQEVRLPDSVLGEPVSWYPPRDERWMQIAGLTLLALCAALIGKNREDEKRERQRERSMQLAYPDIVSRLSLYMGAGVSTRKAWERIVRSYEQKREEGADVSAACEEMRRTLHEMQSGVPESLAYERFGTRCRLPSYLKLGTLLSQNIRKGTKNLANLLAEESGEAFEDRKAFAKKLGEECESKLLLPMILMLLTILIMIMYPAAVSFRV